MRLPSTMVPIASITLNATTTTITFSNIPQTYTDLMVVVTGTHTGSGVAGLRISAINGDGGSNYSDTLLQGGGGGGGSAVSARNSDTSMNIGLIGSSQSGSTFNFMNYSNSTTFKTILSRGNDASALVRAAIGMWRNTAAIRSFSVSGVTFSVGTTATIYGIKAA
ncbi:hypothetical protein UFOVP696_15 [uncultured Caudovirales phage]|uniref:Uncharacterized protein n=1 Tax=uncultured Caudovirales phage TaxID=2100421 RepID=A0A6J5NGS7_9CAUD|nr:hypothetical protein UFOVP429_152 [uncultured Caudovirales phage]CAB4158123.1 hypothetical protein UFOVP696_15 [uncultured Caudovirales phage]